jgi:lipopolysaccharide/colanic/teichoic acid biosynthesis glycosyltransferase
MYKFRTMVQDAESLKQGLKNETDRPMFKMKKDPGVTRIGKFLRSWSLDELPQLLNVLRGDK